MTGDEWKQIWIRNEADEDGYFMLRIERQIGHVDMFLTAGDSSSLTIESKYVVIQFYEV